MSRRGPTVHHCNSSLVESFDTNPNTEFAHSFAFQVLVALAMPSAAFIAQPVIPDSAWRWTVVHAIHCAITFYMFHWAKSGLSSYLSQGRFDSHTFWEQLDNGNQYTPTRKFLILVPVVTTLYILLLTSGTSTFLALVNLGVRTPALRFAFGVCAVASSVCRFGLFCSSTLAHCHPVHLSDACALGGSAETQFVAWRAIIRSQRWSVVLL